MKVENEICVFRSYINRTRANVHLVVSVECCNFL